MITNRDTISRVRSTHRLLSADGSLNDRAILAELKSVASLYIKRELNLRKLVATSTIYTTIPCLQMVQVPLADCCEYTSTEMIARSKYQLPRIGESNYLYAIQGVFSVDGKQKFKEVTPSRYINILKLPASVKQVYYWIQDNYLYVTNADVELIKLSAYFEEDIPDTILYPKDCDCKASTGNPCINPLDKEFKCPQHLLENVVSTVSKTLLSTYFRLPEDRQSDNADGQAPNQPQQ